MMNLSLLVGCFIACLVAVPIKAGKVQVSDVYGKITRLLSNVDGGFKSIASMFLGLRQSTDVERQKLLQLTKDVRRIELTQTLLLEPLRKALSRMEGMNGSLEQLKAMQPACKNNWIRRGASCYKCERCKDAQHCSANIFRDECQKQGGHLAIVRSDEDNEFIASLAASLPGKTIVKNLFIGGRDDLTEGRWLWPDGTHIVFTKWDSGQPDNAGHNQDCMLIWRHRNNKWDDGPCSSRYGHLDTGYVCERHIWN